MRNRRVIVLRDFSMSINEGEIVAVLGIPEPDNHAAKF